jgi:hypothetical protein
MMYWKNGREKGAPELNLELENIDSHSLPWRQKSPSQGVSSEDKGVRTNRDVADSQESSQPRTETNSESFVSHLWGKIKNVLA